MASTNLQQYSLLFVSANGPLLAQESETSCRRSSNGQPVKTVALGYAGDSPGAAMIEFDVTNAVPSTGFEFDAGPSIVSLTPVALYLIGPGGKQLKGTVIIYEDNVTHGVDKPAMYSFKARGAFQIWE